MGLGAATDSSGGAGSPPSCWARRLAAEGCTSTGATMSATSVSGGGCCSCGGGHGNCVNIYVNSNVQGVTNSVLVGSKVVMRDPGPRVSSRHRQPRRREGKRSSRQQQKATTTTTIVGIAVAVAVAVVLLLFVAAAAATGIFLYLFVRGRQ